MMLRVNGEKIGSEPKDIFQMFTMFPHLDYWSKDALQELFIGAHEIGIEICRGEKGGKYTRFISSAQKQIKTFRLMSEKEDREWVLSQIYNKVLQTEGLGTLPGFGFSNRYGDALPGNSEIHSIYKKHN